ncbi:MAG: 54S ribosomal protein L17 mitochondrial [Bathelium mastoideum]|nr:MAG: 54S ribosomal protein L17 mitochondrial [Bathelium mastoideum]
MPKGTSLPALSHVPWASSHICKSCRATISRQRRYATAAAAVAEDPPANNDASALPSSSPQLAYQLRAGVVLSRPPQITRDLTPFEKAFYLYQRRLNERLALPFSHWFYFPKGSAAEKEWKRKIRDRRNPAHEIGTYSSSGKGAWNDEVLIGASESETEHQVDALLEDAQPSNVNEEEGANSAREPVERPMPRVTEADKEGNTKSLDRSLQRTLYLLIKNAEGRWIFPHTRVMGKESLHTAAERLLVQTGGINMNTWVVGNVPIGHCEFNFRRHIAQQKENLEELGEKTFFMKARIMAGQANLAQNAFGDTDFQWLSKEEIENFVTQQYWASIRNMLGDR